MTANRLVQALVAASIGAALRQAPSREIGLADLTVPNDRLPAGCALVAAPSERLEGNQVRTGLWAGLNIGTNPWIGTEAPILATIRERLAPTEVPDGPPLTQAQARRYFLQLADGIDQAYVAIYREHDVSAPTTVYGLQFPTTEDALAFARNARAASKAVVNGRIAAFAAGRAGDCFQAIRDYVSGLSR
jgi:hypothetical protein